MKIKKDYLDVVYDKKKRPFTSYPNNQKHLCERFNLKLMKKF